MGMEQGRQSAESCQRIRVISLVYYIIRSTTCTVYGGPRAKLNLAKAAVSPETEAFRQFCEFKILKPSENPIAIFNLL